MKIQAASYIFQKVGNLDKAQNCFEKAISIEAEYISAYENLARIFKERDKISIPKIIICLLDYLLIKYVLKLC